MTEKQIEKQKIEKKVRSRIKTKIKDLLSFYKDAPLDRVDTYRSAIVTLANINIHIQDCEEAILINGRRIRYQNGKSQWGYKRNDDIDTLKELTLLKIKLENHLQLVLYGENDKGLEDDGFDELSNR